MSTDKQRTNDRPDVQPDHLIDTSGMSQGKADALELAEASRESHWAYPTFAGALFMGQLSWSLIHPFPVEESDHDEQGEAFLERLRTFLREQVDADEIDRTGEIPDDVIRGLAEMGAFGIKTPKEYGGLGLSQQYYSRAAMMLGSHCANTAALLSAHQSIGVPQPLLQFGTEEQKRRFLTRTARGEISAFALTEEGVGSDPARMATTADPTEDGRYFVINGRKLWCTNGTKAGLLVVMAKTPPKIKNGREINQITAFVVEATSPGVTVDYRCRFMGLRALYNAVIDFKDVKVPRENIIAGEGKGLRVALTTLNTGRLTLPANCVGAMRACLSMARDWSNKREQWGSTIGKHAAIADKIARMASTLFAVEAMTMLTSALVDRKQTDIRVEAAMAKMFGTEEAWNIVYDTMQTIGGRGYETRDSLAGRGETPYPIERVMRDMRINTIFEGSSEIMRLFLAREAMDPHLKAAGEAVNTRLPIGRRFKAALRAAGFYALWYPKQWLPLGGPSTAGLEPKLARQVRYVARTSRRLGRRMFHSMLGHGPKMEREQILLGRFVGVGTELFAIAASCARAQQLIERGTDRDDVLALVDHFCRESRRRIDGYFRGIRDNDDAVGYRLAQRILDSETDWLYRGMVDADLDTRRRGEPAELMTN
ncbi:MAG TPA: acyl-CoA dehydrogenase family protein [Candidatus Polarisedimenticolaceae bacterium]|nr:acyl-CoA dehydrogenase family protein [Candidatus Polarisedimenticolaceae bacterium]